MSILDDEFYLNLLKKFNLSLIEVMNQNISRKNNDLISKIKYRLGRKEK